MAEQNKTQIKLELDRIVNAKNVLVEKANEMYLVYTDEDGGTTSITSSTPIEQIASVYDDIYFYNQSDPEHTGHSVNGKVVNLSEGYYTQQSVAVGDGKVYPPTVTIKDTTGELIVTANVDAGYVDGVNAVSTMDITTLEPDITAANIRSGVRMFHVSGTFTSDANVPTTDDGDMLKSDHISEGYTAYKNGKMVMGTMANVDKAERDNTFNPLVDDSYDVCTSPTRYKSLTIGISNDLLVALQAI